MAEVTLSTTAEVKAEEERAKTAESKTRIVAHAWAPSGETRIETLGGFFAKIGSGEEQKIVACTYKLAEGTKATFEVLRNGSGITGLTGLEAKSSETKETVPTAVKLEAKDFINVKVTAIEGNPKVLSITVFVEHI